MFVPTGLLEKHTFYKVTPTRKKENRAEQFKLGDFVFVVRAAHTDEEKCPYEHETPPNRSEHSAQMLIGLVQ